MSIHEGEALKHDVITEQLEPTPICDANSNDTASEPLIPTFRVLYLCALSIFYYAKERALRDGAPGILNNHSGTHVS